MTRTRASAKAAGSSHERAVADYLAEHVSEFIDRRVTTGANDKGDLANVRSAHGGRVVIECKNTAKLNIGPHLVETQVERVNDGAVAGVLIQKRHGVGAVGRQIVVMEVDDLVALLTGKRPSETISEGGAGT